MKKWTHWLLIASAAVLVCGVISTSLYTHELSEQLSEAKRTSRSEITRLSVRIRELESELSSGVLDCLDELFQPTGGTSDAETPSEPETEGNEASDTSAPNETDEPTTEAVTLPRHQSPETQPPTTDATAPSALYLLAEHEGVIGIFDAAGELIKTVNVFVMTLPEADREALSVGIPAYSWQEMCELIARYQ